MSALTHLTPLERQIYAIIERAAHDGAPCPTNSDFSDQVDRGAGIVIARIKDLERKGLITVKRFQRSRVVTLVSTGQSTGTPKGGGVIHWRDRRGRTAAQWRDLLAEEVAQGASVQAAAGKIGCGLQRGYSLWRDIRAGLGWQAQ
ncbi:hypothetical protein [Qipengyuania sp.]|uniref:hypothetical protein n=1 Tax=Qipengyuania sp. TaxID=2004515 RepID=UPI0035C84438